MFFSIGIEDFPQIAAGVFNFFISDTNSWYCALCGVWLLKKRPHHQILRKDPA
jgi:hypothetical protein